MVLVVIAVLLTLLERAGALAAQAKIPERLGAALVVFGAIGVAVGVVHARRPALDWIASAPATIAKVEVRIRSFAKPIAALQQSADRMASPLLPPRPPARAGQGRSRRRACLSAYQCRH